MSAAHEKNLRALGAAADGRLIGSARIGVWTGGARGGPAGLLAEALGELLGRFWRNIDAAGPHAERLAGAAARASAACGAGPAARRAWDPPYDFAIGAGGPAPPGCAPDGVAVRAGGWMAASGHGAPPSGGANPAGALAAAALAAAEAVKSVFGIGAARGAARLPVPHEWNAWYGAAPGGRAEPAADERLDLGEVHVFGVGAVSHALLWIASRWPGGVTGTVHLVGPDSYDAGNPQRYIGTSAGDLGLPKASATARRLRRACPGLEAVAHDTDMNGYFAGDNPRCMVGTAVCGLDSVEGRRQLGLKLPRAAVNMWTSGFHAGASTFKFDDGWPCVHCAYPPPPPGPAVDEASAVHAELGLAPGRARELLDSGRGIDERDAEIIGAATGTPARDIYLRPLRILRAEMCATGRIRVSRPGGGGPGDAHVPLAFASAMAGVAGFTELVRAARGARRDPGQFQVSVLKYPTRHSWTRRGPSPGCFLCTDTVRRHVRAKYADRPSPWAVAQ